MGGFLFGWTDLGWEGGFGCISPQPSISLLKRYFSLASHRPVGIADSKEEAIEGKNFLRPCIPYKQYQTGRADG